jgi:hypothetical protein
VQGHVCLRLVFALSCVGRSLSPVKAILSDAYKYDSETGKHWTAFACPVIQEEHTVHDKGSMNDRILYICSAVAFYARDERSHIILDKFSHRNKCIADFGGHWHYFKLCE